MVLNESGLKGEMRGDGDVVRIEERMTGPLGYKCETPVFDGWTAEEELFFRGPIWARR